MNGATQQVILGLPPLCAEVQAWANAVPTRPSNSYLYSLNTFVIGLKNAGIWQLLDRFWIFATQFRDNAKIDIKSLSTLTEVPNGGTLTWTANVGYKGDGVASYLNLNFTPSTQAVNFTLNNCCLGAYLSGNMTGTGQSQALTGAEGSAGQFSHISAGSTVNSLFTEINEATSTSYNANYPNFSSTTKGYYYANRTANGQNKSIVYASNGVIIPPVNPTYTGTNNTTSLPNVSVYALAANDNGTLVYYNSGTLGIVFYGSGSISATTLYNLIQPFATSIGFAA
jgi:hypothetical protein